MARVTVEDCIVKVPNRFELVMLAAQRGRSLGAGAPLAVDRDNDKNPVVALREIADNAIDLKELELGLVRSLQKVVESDEPQADELDLLAMSRAMDSEPSEAGEAVAFEEDELDAALAEGEDEEGETEGEEPLD